jgi:transposase-like protein
MIDFKGSQFEREVILWGARWYVAYPISYRQLVTLENRLQTPAEQFYALAA